METKKCCPKCQLYIGLKTVPSVFACSRGNCPCHIPRRIKYRAWDGTTFRHDFTLDHDGTVRLTRYCAFGQPTEIVDWTVSRCIDLKDNVDRDIFEDDIVEVAVGDYKVRMQVKWSDALCGWFPFVDKSYDALTNPSLKIVGNIYENPELLEK